MDIGSAKPTAEERSRVRHYLIDEVLPDYSFTAGDFCRRALQATEKIKSAGMIPLFSGGTGLYIDSFFKGISDIPDIDPAIREEIYRELEEFGLERLYADLKIADPEFAGRIHPNDRQRIFRGLEVYRGSGRALSSYYSSSNGHGSDDTLFIGLYDERDVIIKRIDARVDRMIASGLVDEVAGLRSLGYGAGLKSMKSIGYAEINSFIDGKITLDEAIESIKIETRRYAKRQMTWFRRNKQIKWFKSVQKHELRSTVEEWINN